MKICVTTFGSEGDHQPYIALAHRLSSAGHTVIFAAIDRYAERARNQGLDARTVGRPWVDKSGPEVERAFREKNPAKQGGMFTSLLRDDLIATVPDLLALTREVDVVVSHSFNVAGTAAALANRKPVVVGHLFHNTIRAANANPLGARVPKLLNPLLWWLAGHLMRRYTDPPMNAVVAAAGLPPWRDVFFRASHSRSLNLIAISPSVVPPDPLWHDYVLTGYWFMPPARFSPDPELAAFVSGERPVVVTFGSMVAADPGALTACIVDAARRAGRKVLIQAGAGNLAQGTLPTHVRAVGFVPHDWLFQHAACVVHHGGAGTVAAAVRAGVPSIVVPHMGDQFLWAKILEQRGLSGPWVAAQHLTVDWLAHHLARTLEDAMLAQRAWALAELLRAEDGVAEATHRIEAAWNTGQLVAR